MTAPCTTQPGGPNCWDPKGTIERLCKQEMYAPDGVTRRVIADLLGVLQLHRPVGSNGKHGELHTPTCGCERSEDGGTP